jgi:hypothetical protein
MVVRAPAAIARGATPWAMCGVIHRGDQLFNTPRAAKAQQRIANRCPVSLPRSLVAITTACVHRCTPNPPRAKTGGDGTLEREVPSEQRAGRRGCAHLSAEHSRAFSALIGRVFRLPGAEPGAKLAGPRRCAPRRTGSRGLPRCRGRPAHVMQYRCPLPMHGPTPITIANSVPYAGTGWLLPPPSRAPGGPRYHDRRLTPVARRGADGPGSAAGTRQPSAIMGYPERTADR